MTTECSCGPEAFYHFFADALGQSVDIARSFFDGESNRISEQAEKHDACSHDVNMIFGVFCLSVSAVATRYAVEALRIGFCVEKDGEVGTAMRASFESALRCSLAMSEDALLAKAMGVPAEILDVIFPAEAAAHNTYLAEQQRELRAILCAYIGKDERS